ncbi:hypothetical protein Glo7428_4990 (plasmid) [Gloeocapsa sp. PCC 7428]|uniref:hypothetical protein n=1 Tax=Gloeocapsa sp. PCC 7428 TaxID=1173026 RepID=UPI0002A5E542|nr:hypothetical protein [Gloeocapsa sp. PCC 7428]AFZ33392.1 hypothetical protein Glo7428_4990 [Gloeocapsa sp. PCC 7428]
MLQNKQCIHSLIKLREHYQTLLPECVSTISHPTEQLDRTYTLLIDQLVEQQLVESLLQLRTYSKHY